MNGSKCDLVNGTSGSQISFEQEELKQIVVENEDVIRSISDDNSNITLPTNDSQIKHIFNQREGHLPDSPANRKTLVDLANDKTKFLGTDKYNNSWHAEVLADGTQNWVRHRSGIINEGGKNRVPRNWNNDVGLNNPIQNRRKKK